MFPTFVRSLTFVACVSFGLYASPQDRSFPKQTMQLSEPTRGWFKNPDGSCVQCSIGMAGVHCNDLNAASLLWDTAYGPAVRKGSWPERVARYCNDRGIKAYNITGWPTTRQWMEWAARTGRFAAIGAGNSHFQTLYGWDQSTDTWYVCNNNSTDRVDEYSRKEFEKLHLASGPWVVVLLRSSSENPKMVQWWR